MQTNISIEARFGLVNPVVCSVTPGRKLSPEDLGLTEKDLPPKDLHTLGRLYTFPASEVNFTDRISAKMRSICLQKGTAFAGGFMIGDSYLPEVIAELNKCVAEYFAEFDDLVARWDKVIDDHCNKPEHAKFAAKLRSLAPTQAYLQKQLDCYYDLHRAVALTDSSSPDVDAVGQATFAKSVRRAGSSALSEIAQDAEEIWRASLHDRKTGSPKADVTQKILRPIRRIAEKLDALTFVEARFSTVAVWIRSVLAALPADGKMSGEHLASINGLVNTLRDPDATLAQAELYSSGTVDVGAAAVAEAQVSSQLPLAVQGPEDVELDLPPDVAPTSAAPAVVVPASQDLAAPAPNVLTNAAHADDDVVEFFL